MSERAILNPDVAWRDDIQDSIGPNYGWERLRRSRLAVVKPAFGQPWSRNVSNGGHTTQFSWVGRSRACIEMLKQWAEQHEQGFFTVIDQDGGGRHYVGNFVGDMPQVQGGNDTYNVQGWTFEEIPGCPMLQYPADWDHWAIDERPFDDYGDARSAVSTVNFVRPAAVAGDDGIARVPNQLTIAAPAAGDAITHEYVGYGFRLWAAQGPEYGIVTLLVDGAQVATIDLYNVAEQGVAIVYENDAMPLDVHRVQVVMTATKNVAATGTGLLWDKVQVMR